MKYSTGNNRRGTGRTKQRMNGPEHGQLDLGTQFLLMSKQVSFAQKTGVNLDFYLEKMDEFLSEHPEYKEMIEQDTSLESSQRVTCQSLNVPGASLAGNRGMCAEVDTLKDS